VLTGYQISLPTSKVPPHYRPCLVTATEQLCRSALLYAELNLFLPANSYLPPAAARLPRGQGSKVKKSLPNEPTTARLLHAKSTLFPSYAEIAQRSMPVSMRETPQRDMLSILSVISVIIPWLVLVKRQASCRMDRHTDSFFFALDSKKASRAR
jgi:hypothetical protein